MYLDIKNKNQYKNQYIYPHQKAPVPLSNPKHRYRYKCKE